MIRHLHFSRTFAPLVGGVLWGALSFQTVVAAPYVQGIVKAADETVLSSEMAGRIDRLPVDEGEYFSEGDLLAGFTCDILAAENRVADAAVKGAQARYDNTKRLDLLKAAGALDLALTKASLEESLAEQNVVAARIKQCTIVAPFDGMVLAREIEPFESVNVMTPLLKIGRKAALRLMVIIPARWLPWIKPGATFSFKTAAGGKVTRGRVDKIGATVDPSSQTIKLEGELIAKPGHRLVPGIGGSVSFPDLPGDAE
jgi:membrane fusion protein, multidrug efflux system